MSLIHWWPLTEDLTDKIGLTNLQNTSSITIDPNGKINSCVKLTRVGLSVVNPFIELNNWSLAFWMRDDEMANWHDVICWSSNLNRLEIHGDGTHWAWYQGKASGETSPEELATGSVFKSGITIKKDAIRNKWYHIAIVKNNTNAFLYIDGDCVITSTTSINFTAGSTTMHFNSRADTSYGNISFNDIRAYDHALSLAEVQELKKGLVLHYTFDDILIEQNMLYNETGLTQHNAINNAILNKTDAAIGKYSLSCNNTYIKTSIIGDITHGATASMWVKIPTYPTANQVVFADYNSKLAFGFYGTQNAIISCGDYEVGIINNIKQMWKESDWNHVVIMRNISNQFSCYLNGEQLTLSNTTNNWTTSSDCIIGCRNNGTYNTYFNGLIDDFRLYYTHLSPEEIKDLYNCGGRISNLGDALTGEFIETHSGNLVTAADWQQMGIQDANGQSAGVMINHLSTNYIPVFANTTYYYRATSDINVRGMHYYNKDLAWIGYKTYNKNAVSDTTPEQCAYVRWVIQSTNASNDIPIENLISYNPTMAYANIVNDVLPLSEKTTAQVNKNHTIVCLDINENQKASLMKNGKLTCREIIEI